MKQISKNLAISTEQLSQDIKNQKPLLVFDLRESDEFVKSHVKGSVHAVCDTRAKEKIMPKIPKTAKIVLISEPENLSVEVAQMMKEFGLDAYYLDGGFSSWNGEKSQGRTTEVIEPENLLKNLDRFLLLDVRNVDEFSEYQIPWSINIPLEDLFDEKAMKKIPKDKEIVTICPHGNRAMIASFALAREGISSKTLSGGLTKWNQVLNPVSVISEEVQIIQIQKVGKGCLSHIVRSGKEAIVIDPLYPFEKYIEIAKKQGFAITKVFDTHQHADHVSSARDLAENTGAKLYLSKYEGYDFGANFIGDNDKIDFGKSTLRSIHTPGHTPGSLSYVVDERYVFTGDILFVESIGRPDLRDKAKEFTEELYVTLHEKLLSLPHYMMVFPTHHGTDAKDKEGAYYSTIQESKNLQWLDIPREEFVSKVAEKALPRPMNFRRIIGINKGQIQLNHLEIPDLEIGPNRCAVDGS
jgi:glyoxylase-like metal-dependent hydrolase (beta-lactamase superfamily II)